MTADGKTESSREGKRHSTGANVGFVGGAAALQIVLQFLFSRVLASYFGADSESDALNAALVIPTVCYTVMTGSLSYVLVPELVAKFNDAKQQESAWQLAAYVALVVVGIGSCVSGLLFFNAATIVRWFYPDVSPEQAELTHQVLRILSIQVLLNGLVSWSQAVHHSRHHFLAPALGGVVGMTLSLLMAHLFGQQSILMIAWAINLGSLTSVCVQCSSLVKRLGKPRAEQKHLIKLLNRLWPLLLGAAFIRLDPLVDRILASELDTGSVTHIHFAQRIMAALLSIGSSSLALIAFPQLSEKLAAEGMRGFCQHFALASRRILMLIVPIAIGVSLFSVEIISDLLEQGRFGSEDSQVVGWLVFLLMGMFLGASSGELLARGFYVLEDTRTPTLIGVLSLALALCVKFVLFKYFIGIWGIAFGVSFYFLLSAATMALVLVRRVGREMLAGFLPAAVQATAASLVACAGCWLVYVNRPLLGGVGATWLAAPVGVIGYVLCLLLFGNQDVKSAVDYGAVSLGFRKKSG